METQPINPLPLVRSLIAQGPAGAAHAAAIDALERAKRNPGPGQENVAFATAALAEVELSDGDGSAAVAHFERALSMLHGDANYRQVATASVLDGLALAYASLGDPSDAERYFVEAVTYREKHFGMAHPTVAVALEHLASFYAEGHFEDDRAELLLRRALDILGDERANALIRARLLGECARDVMNRGHYADAIPLLEEQIRIVEVFDGANLPAVAAPLHELALARAGLRQVPAAESLLGQALELVAPDGMPTEESIRYETDLADVFRQQDERAAAITHYERALAGRQFLGGPDDIDAVKIEEALEELRSMA